MTRYTASILDEDGNWLFDMWFDADDAEHAREQAQDALSEGEQVGLVFPSPGGAIGRLERFVASGGDTEVLLEGLPEAADGRFEVDPETMKTRFVPKD